MSSAGEDKACLTPSFGEISLFSIVRLIRFIMLLLARKAVECVSQESRKRCNYTISVWRWAGEKEAIPTLMAASSLAGQGHRGGDTPD